jgi:hypothetical protein
VAPKSRACLTKHYPQPPFPALSLADLPRDSSEHMRRRSCLTKIVATIYPALRCTCTKLTIVPFASDIVLCMSGSSELKAMHSMMCKDRQGASLDVGASLYPSE